MSSIKVNAKKKFNLPHLAPPPPRNLMKYGQSYPKTADV